MTMRRTFEGEPKNSGIIPVTDKDAIIPERLWDPSDMDHRFLGTGDGITIFADPKPILVPDGNGTLVGSTLRYTADDVLRIHKGYEAIADATRRAKDEVGNNRTVRYLEHVLRIVFDEEDLWVGQVRVGVNRGTGYSYKTYGHLAREPK